MKSEEKSEHRELILAELKPDRGGWKWEIRVWEEAANLYRDPIDASLTAPLIGIDDYRSFYGSHRSEEKARAALRKAIAFTGGLIALVKFDIEVVHVRSLRVEL